MRNSLAVFFAVFIAFTDRGVDAIAADKVVVQAAEQAIVKQAAQQGILNGVVPGVITRQQGTQQSTFKAPIDHLINTPEEVEKSKQEGGNCGGGFCKEEKPTVELDDKKPDVKIDTAKVDENAEKSKKEGEKCAGGSCAPEDKQPHVKLDTTKFDQHSVHHHHHHDRDHRQHGDNIKMKVHSDDKMEEHVDDKEAKKGHKGSSREEFLGDDQERLRKLEDTKKTEETKKTGEEESAKKTVHREKKEGHKQSEAEKNPEEKAKEDEAVKEKEKEHDTWWWLFDGSHEEESKNEEKPDPTKITDAEENDLERKEEGLVEGAVNYMKKEYPTIYNKSIGPLLNSVIAIKQITNEKLVGNIGAGLIAAAPQAMKPFYTAQIRPFMKAMHKYVLPIVAPYVAIAMGALNGFRSVSSEKVSAWVETNFPFSSRLGEFAQHQALNLPVLMAVRGWFGIEIQKFMQRGYGFFIWFYDKVGHLGGVTTGVLTRLFRGLPRFLVKETEQDLKQVRPLEAGLENLKLPAGGIKDVATGALILPGNQVNQQAAKNLRASYKTPEQIAAQENADPVLHIRNAISDGVFGFAGTVLSPIDKLMDTVFGWALTPLDYLFANPYVIAFLDHGKPSRFVGHLFKFMDDWFQGKPIENIQAVEVELLAAFLESEKELEKSQFPLGHESTALTFEEEANALGIPEAVTQLGLPRTPTQKEIQTQFTLQNKIRSGVQLTDEEVKWYKQGVEEMKLINTNMPTIEPLSPQVTPPVAHATGHTADHHQIGRAGQSGAGQQSAAIGAAIRQQIPRALTEEELAKLQHQMEEAKKIESLKLIGEDPAEAEMRSKIFNSPHTPIELLNHTGDAKTIFGDIKFFATNPSKDNPQQTLRDTLTMVKQDPAVVAEIQQAVSNVKDGKAKNGISNLIHGNPSQDDINLIMSAIKPSMMGKKIGEDDGMVDVLGSIMGSKMGVTNANGGGNMSAEKSPMAQMLKSVDSQTTALQVTNTDQPKSIVQETNKSVVNKARSEQANSAPLNHMVHHSLNKIGDAEASSGTPNFGRTASENGYPINYPGESMIRNEERVSIGRSVNIGNAVGDSITWDSITDDSKHFKTGFLQRSTKEYIVFEDSMEENGEKCIIKAGYGNTDEAFRTLKEITKDLPEILEENAAWENPFKERLNEAFGKNQIQEWDFQVARKSGFKVQYRIVSSPPKGCKDFAVEVPRVLNARGGQIDPKTKFNEIKQFLANPDLRRVHQKHKRVLLLPQFSQEPSSGNHDALYSDLSFSVYAAGGEVLIDMNGFGSDKPDDMQMQQMRRSFLQSMNSLLVAISDLNSAGFMHAAISSGNIVFLQDYRNTRNGAPTEEFAVVIIGWDLLRKIGDPRFCDRDFGGSTLTMDWSPKSAKGPSEDHPPKLLKPPRPVDQLALVLVLSVQLKAFDVQTHTYCRDTIRDGFWFVDGSLSQDLWRRMVVPSTLPKRLLLNPLVFLLFVCVVFLVIVHQSSSWHSSKTGDSQNHSGATKSLEVLRESVIDKLPRILEKQWRKNEESKSCENFEQE